MQLDDSATAKCCELLRDYHWRANRRAEADAWHQRLIDRQALVGAAERERNRVLTSDKFDRHGLDAAVRSLRDQLEKTPGLAMVYIVKKRLKHLAHIPCYILGFRARGFFRFQRKRYDADILQQIQHNIRLPGETLIMRIDGENYRFARKFAWVRGTRIL